MPPPSVQLPPAHDLEKIAYGSSASILIFSDDADQLRWMEAAVAAAGGRVSVALGLDDAVHRIADHAAPDGVIVGVGTAAPRRIEDIFDTIEQGARSQRFRSIALIGPDLIDLAAARAGHSDVQLLCEPDEAGFAVAMSGLLVRRKLKLNDINADARPVRLRELSEEVGRIARTLAALSARESRAHRPFGAPIEDGGFDQPMIDAPGIRAMIRARRLRSEFFEAELFADPAWDMLLDLMAAQLEGRSVAVSSLCIAAAVPPTTALRWIKTLTDIGLFVRVADPDDRRRIFIELSPGCADAMRGCLAAMGRAVARPF